MEIRHGLISADSHVVTEPNAFLDRMSKNQFGERIPQIKEIDNKGQSRALVRQWPTFALPRRVQLPGGDGRSQAQSLSAALGGSAG